VDLWDLHRAALAARLHLRAPATALAWHPPAAAAAAAGQQQQQGARLALAAGEAEIYFWCVALLH